MTAIRAGSRRALAVLTLAGAVVAAPGAFAARINVTVVTAAGAPVADVAVVAEPLNGQAPHKRTHARIEQRDREFEPYLTIVQKDTAVEFPNRDKIKHHVYSFSPAKMFELKLYSGKPAAPVLFDKTGAVALGCNIHDWMEAHVLVVDTPWFGKTGDDGAVALRDLPAGQYRLRVWHPRQRAEVAAESIELTTKGTLQRSIVIEVAERVHRPRSAIGSDEY